MELVSLDKELIYFCDRNSIKFIRRQDWQEPKLNDRVLLIDDVDSTYNTLSATIGGVYTNKESYVSTGLMCLTGTTYTDLENLRKMFISKMLELDYHLISEKETRDSKRGFPYTLLKFKKTKGA